MCRLIGITISFVLALALALAFVGALSSVTVPVRRHETTIHQKGLECFE